jgi:hypothetical protein
MTLAVTPGSGQTIQTLDDVAKGAGASSASTLRTVIASDQSSIPVSISAEVEVKNDTGNPLAVAGTVSLTDISAAEYETVAASASAQVIGSTGAIGDYLAELLIVPASTSPGAVSIQDGSGTAITVFVGGASSVSNLVPFSVPLGIKSTGGAWKVTTGANVSAIAVGNFT